MIRRQLALLLGFLSLSLTAWAQTAAPIFVLNSLDANISVIDPITWKVVKTLPTGKEPHHLYLTPDEKSVIVANAASDSLTFIDPRTAEVQRVVRGIIDPYHLRFSPDMKWLVTVANRLNHIDLYRWDGTTPTLVKRIPSSKTPSHIWIDNTSTIAYVTMQDSDEMIASAASDVKTQLDPMGDDVVAFGNRYAKAKIRKFNPDSREVTEADALIAYLQMLGTLVDFKLYDNKADLR